MTLAPLAKRDAYDALMRKLRYPVSVTLRKIFELSCTREEAEVMVELPAPAVEIAKKLNRDVKTVEAQIENVFQMGLIREITTPDDKLQYIRIDAIEPLSDSMMYVFGPRFLDHGTGTLHKHTLRDEKTMEICDLWTKFFYEEWYRWDRPDELVHRRVAIVGGADAGRSFAMMPCFKALEKSQPLGCEILPGGWDLRDIAKQGEDRGILVRVCTCRTRARKCDRPIWTCGALIEGEPGFPAWYTKDRRGVFKKFSGEEWLEGMGMYEEELGMVHIGSAMRKGCTCCSDCCNWLEPLRLYTEPWEGVHPSPYRAVVNTEVCEGCVKNCVPRCQFRVIKGQTDPSSGKIKASVDLEKCVGCGQCVIGCPVEGAIKLDLADKIGAPVSPIGARLKIPENAAKRGPSLLSK